MRQGEGRGQDLGGQGPELEQGLGVEMGKGERGAEGAGQNEATSWKQGQWSPRLSLLTSGPLY